MFYPHPNQIVQDAYDSLIANLFNWNRNDMPKSIAITGRAKGIGKTTISINFSLALVMAGWRVVLLDVDLRKTGVSKRLASDNLLGVTDYLAKLAEYQDILTTTNFDNFTYIPCGDIANNNPIGLLHSARFERLMDQLKRDFDFVIFDTSALDANADASVIASKSDGVFFIAQVGESTTRVQQELERLAGRNVRVLMTILNKSTRSEYKRFMGFYDYTKTRKNKFTAIKHKNNKPRNFISD